MFRKINISIAKESLKALGIDKYGLDDMDRQILSALIDKFDGGPVGVKSLSVAVSEDSSTIEDVYEHCKVSNVCILLCLIIKYTSYAATGRNFFMRDKKVSAT